MYRLVTLLMDHKEDLDENAKRHRQKVVDFIRKTLKLAQVCTVTIRYYDTHSEWQKIHKSRSKILYTSFE